MFQDYERSNLVSNPYQNGAFYTYEFSSGSVIVYNPKLSNTSIPMMSTGILNITISDSMANIGVVDKLCVAGIISYIQVSRYTCSISSKFVGTILNNIDLQKGSVVSINYGMVGTVLGNSKYPQCINYQGGNSTLQKYATDEGVFHTISVAINNFNTSGVPQTFLNGGDFSSPNELAYGNAQGANVLIFMLSNGNSGFLNKLYSSSNTSFVRTYEFFMEAIATNVAISPIDYTHYLTYYIFDIAIIWVIGITYLFILYKRLIRKNKEILREKT